MKTKMTAKRWTIVAIAICLISLIGTSLVQTSNNKIRIKNMAWDLFF